MILKGHRSILLVCDAYPPEARSAATLIAGLAMGLRARGWQVTVLTCGERFQKTCEDGVSVVRVPCPQLHDVPAWRKGMAWLFLPAIFGGASLLLRTHFDVVWVYSPPLTLALAGLAVKRAQHSAFVLHVQDLFPDNAIDLGLLKNGGVIRFWRFVESLAYKGADRIVVHSPGHVPWLARHRSLNGRSSDILVIPNFVDTEALERLPGEEGLKSRFGLAGRFVFVFGGVMGFAQDIATIATAARHLQKQDKIGFLMVGSGVARPYAQALAQGLQNIVFHDWIPGGEFAKWAKACDAGLVTLRKEMRTPVVPSKTLFYMALGLPIVAAVPRSSDAYSLICEARCGIWVPPGEPEALAKACELLASDPEAAKAMGKRGHDFCLERFTSAKVLSAVDAILEEVLGRRGGRSNG